METTSSEIEAIPHVCKRLCLIWGTSEFDVFVNSLVMDSRDGARKGLPMAVGAELLWLVKVNKWRRALEYQERLKIGVGDALAKVQMEDDAITGSDVWSAPIIGGVNLARRHSDKPLPLRPRRRSEENTVFGIIFGVVTNRYSLLAIIAILTVKGFWSTIRLFL